MIGWSRANSRGGLEAYLSADPPAGEDEADETSVGGRERIDEVSQARIEAMAPETEKIGENRGRLGRRWPPILATQARRDEPREVDRGVTFTLDGLEIASKEAMKDRMRGEECQPQNEDRVGMMMEVVIGVPVGHQFIEALVLDLPAIMPKRGNGLRWRQ